MVFTIAHAYSTCLKLAELATSGVVCSERNFSTWRPNITCLMSNYILIIGNALAPRDLLISAMHCIRVQCIELLFAELHYTMSHWPALYWRHGKMHSIVKRSSLKLFLPCSLSNTMHCAALHCDALHCDTLHFSALYFATLHFDLHFFLQKHETMPCEPGLSLQKVSANLL